MGRCEHGGVAVAGRGAHVMCVCVCWLCFRGSHRCAESLVAARPRRRRDLPQRHPPSARAPPRGRPTSRPAARTSRGASTPALGTARASPADPTPAPNGTNRARARESVRRHRPRPTTGDRPRGLQNAMEPQGAFDRAPARGTQTRRGGLWLRRPLVSFFLSVAASISLSFSLSLSLSLISYLSLVRAFPLCESLSVALSLSLSISLSHTHTSVSLGRVCSRLVGERFVAVAIVLFLACGVYISLSIHLSLAGARSPTSSRKSFIRSVTATYDSRCSSSSFAWG